MGGIGGAYLSHEFFPDLMFQLFVFNFSCRFEMVWTDTTKTLAKGQSRVLEVSDFKLGECVIKPHQL